MSLSQGNNKDNVQLCGITSWGAVKGNMSLVNESTKNQARYDRSKKLSILSFFLSILAPFLQCHFDHSRNTWMDP